MQTKEDHMKCRGIVVIDYDIEGSFLEAAEEQTKLQEAIASQTPDIKSMKFRNS
jgi:hypothetical protein